MFPNHIQSIRQLLEEFPTEESCLDFLEHRRWGGKVLSPFAPGVLAWQCKKDKRKYICRKTNKYFTVRTGSIFEKTKIPLRDWFVAIWLITTHKKGDSSVHLSRQLNITVKSAWLLGQKIRRFFDIQFEPQEATENIKVYELDEAVFGGLNGNRHDDKKIPNSQGGHGIDKTWVFGMIERGGLLRAFAIPARDGAYVQPIIRKLIPRGSVIISDAWTGYNGLADDYDHHVVKDGRKAYEYNAEVHSNTIEGAWGIMKRGYNGIYNWWSKKHLQFYINEFVFRYNTRGMKDIARFSLFLDNVFRRITHRDIIDTPWNYQISH